MTHEPITPALTAGEWRLVQLWAVGKIPGGKVRGMVVLDLPATHRHGAAACALYGQPYGFTREMVRALRGAQPVEYTTEGMALILDAADRIEALLPPETP